MAGVTISSLSTEYVYVPVRAFSDGAPYNPTVLPVQMAFVNGWAKPGTISWNTAGWSSSPNGTYAARCLVGPGSAAVSLAIGTWNVWVEITATPEVPVLQSGGVLTIT